MNQKKHNICLIFASAKISKKIILKMIKLGRDLEMNEKP